MATVNSIPEQRQNPSSMRGVMDYCRQEEKVFDPVSERKLVTGVRCGGETAYDEFMLTKLIYGKTDGVFFYQFTQSFDSRATISSADAHALALEFAERAWPGHEVLVCTHCDTDNPHSHFVINSVSREDGHKLHLSPAGFRKLRELSDELCLAHGYPVVKPQQHPVKGMSAREYRSAAKGESWKLRLMYDIDQCMRRARTRKEFEEEMRRRGYAVRWTAERKYITYTTLAGMKCRDNKLHEEKYLKERMEHEFRIREELFFGRTETVERRGYSDGTPGRAAYPGDRKELGGGAEGAGTPEHTAVTAADSLRASADEGGSPGTARRSVDGGGSVRSTGWEYERALCFQRGESDVERAGFDWEGGGVREVVAGEDAPRGEREDLRSDTGIPAAAGDTGRGVSDAHGLGDRIGHLLRALEGTVSTAPVHDATTMPSHTDRKQLRKKQEKKIALGHKPDDHEEDLDGHEMNTPW